MPTAALPGLLHVLPKGIASAELAGEGDPALLSTAERQLMRRARPKRVREFAAGRVCARRALARLGLGEVSIGLCDGRRPLWPPGLTGSITHTAGFCAAAVAERQRFRAIGIDAEILGGVSHDLWWHVFLPEETETLASLPALQQTNAATRMFSAKEAFYKCQYEVTGEWLEFRDVRVDFLDGDAHRGRIAVRPVSRIRFFEHQSCPAIVHFAAAGDRVLSAMTLAA